MDSFYASNSYCPIAGRPVFGHDIVQTGGPLVSNPACYFGGFAVAEHTVDSPHPCQDLASCHSAFTRLSPAVPVSQYCGTPLIDRIPCSHGAAGLPATGQLVAEAPPERFVLVRHKEPSNVVRTFFTEPMRKVLEAYYVKSNYVSKKDRQQLARDLQVTEKQIRVWFQNRRVKDRKKLARCLETCGRPPDVCQASEQMAGKPISGDARERASSIAPTPLKSLDTRCQDFRPSLSPVSDEEESQYGDGTISGGRSGPAEVECHNVGNISGAEDQHQQSVDSQGDAGAVG